MNYIKELNSLHEFLMGNTLCNSEVSLIHTLYSIDNKRNWEEWFSASNAYVMQLSGIANKQTLWDARNKLKQRGRIDFINGKRNTDNPKYKIIPFSQTELVGGLDQALDQRLDQALDQRLDQRLDQALDHKEKTKLNKTKELVVVEDAPARAPAKTEGRNFAENPSAQRLLTEYNRIFATMGSTGVYSDIAMFLADGFDEDVIIHAFNIANDTNDRNKRGWNYIKSILVRYGGNEIKTMSDVERSEAEWEMAKPTQNTTQTAPKNTAAQPRGLFGVFAREVNGYATESSNFNW